MSDVIHASSDELLPCSLWCHNVVAFRIDNRYLLCRYIVLFCHVFCWYHDTLYSALCIT